MLLFGLLSRYKLPGNINDILIAGNWSDSFMTQLQDDNLGDGGYSLARLIRMPVPYLTGPLFLSITLHLAGLVHIPRINEFVFLAQVTIGGAVGARLAQVDLAELAVYLKDALVVVLLLLSVFVAAAGLVAALVGLPFFDVMLSFVPGGLYEVTLLSFIFGFDVAFVALHHGFRMLFILFSLPWVLKWLKKGEQ